METVIYVKLIDEGIDVWRPVRAKAGSKPGTFHIIGAVDDSSDEGEQWEFPIGSIVFCELRELDGKRCHVAVANPKK